MLESKDIMYYAISFGVVIIALALTWGIVYGAKILKEIYILLRQIERVTSGVEKLVDVAINKVEKAGKYGKIAGDIMEIVRDVAEDKIKKAVKKSAAKKK